MIPSVTKIQDIVERHRFTFAIIFALIIASILTTVSMALYVSSGASRLDLSRPGYEKVRSDAKQRTEEKPFSSTGPLNSGVVEDFQSRLDKRREALNKLDTFGTNALEDSQLLIAPEEQASP